MIFKKKKKKIFVSFSYSTQLQKDILLLIIDRTASKKLSILKLSMVFNGFQCFTKK